MTTPKYLSYLELILLKKIGSKCKEFVMILLWFFEYRKLSFTQT